MFHLFLYPSSYSRMEEMLVVDQVALYWVGSDEMDLLVTMGGRGEPAIMNNTEILLTWFPSEFSAGP